MGEFWLPYAREKEGAELTPYFRRDGTTKHMDRTYGAVQRERNPGYKNARHYFDGEFEHDCRTFQKMVPRRFWSLAREYSFGNPRTGKWMGMRVGLTSLDFAYMIWRLHPWLKKAETVLEIGGGFGGLARTLLDHKPSLRMTLVDLAPMLRIQEYFLRNTGRCTNVTLAKNEVPDGTRFDVVVAARMMCELDLNEVGRHLGAIDQALNPGGIFYCVHHLECINRFRDWPLPKWERLLDRQFPFERRKNWREKIWARRK